MMCPLSTPFTLFTAFTLSVNVVNAVNGGDRGQEPPNTLPHPNGPTPFNAEKTTPGLPLQAEGKIHPQRRANNH
jgi:hypothetical protein